MLDLIRQAAKASFVEGRHLKMVLVEDVEIVYLKVARLLRLGQALEHWASGLRTVARVTLELVCEPEFLMHLSYYELLHLLKIFMFVELLYFMGAKKGSCKSRVFVYTCV